MRNVKIVADSSADVLALSRTPFAAAPMKIVTAEREFIDDAAIDVEEMVAFFAKYKERSQTSCPNPADYLAAFGQAEEIFCVTITSGLSGSYNAASIAKQTYEAEHEGRRVCVIDSLSAGPELKLIIEELEECIEKDMPYEEIVETITAYRQQTGLVFMLESLNNFAANGRVSPAVAKIAGVLGIRIVGRASDAGTLEPLHKCRGETRSLAQILSHLLENGLSRGKVRIAHCRAEAAAERLKAQILKERPEADVQISTLRGLCSYYAENGGLLVGYEKA